jgi:hypothetical protein
MSPPNTDTAAARVVSLAEDSQAGAGRPGR